METEKKLQELKVRLAEVSDLELAGALLSWDQATYMPPGGAEARGRQMATLARLAQEKFIDPALGRLLDELHPYAESLPYDSDDASLIRVTRRNYERAVKVPPAFLAEINMHSAASFQAWMKARPANDFQRMEPLLEKTLDASRRLANFFPGYAHIADPLIDFSDEGMQAASLRALFAELRSELAPIVQAVTAQPPADDACLHQHFPQNEQEAFSLEVIRRLGYDFERGRADKTHHPFMTKFSLGDVRITTRYDEHNLSEALFSFIHEMGHALYEQGIDRRYEATPLAGGTSSGVHESSSRMWENIVGRSRPFWERTYPDLQKAFPRQLGDVPLDTFYRAINKVERSLIRTAADEVTYNLHVMLRFDFELQLLEGSLAVRDLPDAWNQRYQADLGLAPPDDRDGVLQDVHWYAGLVGGSFQGYTLGNLIGPLFLETALVKCPEIAEEFRHGQFAGLHTWLKENVYRHGSKFTAPELIERVTGGTLTIQPYLRYLRQKYGELYKI
jgi:carboxypeptidase Taq